jgi:hypothetical protein
MSIRVLRPIHVVGCDNLIERRELAKEYERASLVFPRG